MRPFVEQDDIPQLPAIGDRRKLEKLIQLTEGLRLSDETVKRVQKVFEDEMNLGLVRNPAKKSSLLMENTYIPELPDGTEDGYYMALDLGGTHCRVILIRLEDGEPKEPFVEYYDVPEKVRLGPGTKLFDFLASCIYEFMKTNDLLHKMLPLGFTFSFPMMQKALDVGILVTWTKSFNSPGVVGQDAVKMLKDAIKRRGDIDVEVVAILNDTTGTLVQGAHLDPKCCIGLILGTGSNACYVERADRVEKWENKSKDIKEVLIDVEWGAFGDNGVIDFIKTDFDRQVDANSLLVNSFTFEKYFSGKYLGEVARVILVKLAQEGVLFGGKISNKLDTKNEFTTSYISHIEEDQEESTNTRAVLNELGLLADADEDDIRVVRYICSLISIRAAKLISACMSCLLKRVNRPDMTVAIDGSLYKYHPHLHNLLMKYTSQLVPDKEFRLILAEDGSGKGAGLVAAIATRLRKHKKVVVMDYRG